MKSRNLPLFMLFATFTACCYGQTTNTCPEIPFPLGNSAIDIRIMDCHGFSWTSAFANLHSKISREYAYGTYENIDWNALYTKYQPLIAAAQASGDTANYYQALLDYASELHDWHVYLTAVTNPAKQNITQVNYEHIGGSYGLIITATDDGKYIASYIATNGAADQAGIMAGAEIISWNNLAIKEAINLAPLTWNNNNENQPSTTAGINYEKTRLLVRDKIGSQVKISFKNPNKPEATYATLTAIDDNNDTLNRTYLYPNENVAEEDYVSGTILSPNNYGYIKVVSENHEDADAKKSASYQKFHTLIKEFNDKNVPGVILDLRGNNGGGTHENIGLDLSLDIAGFFTTNTQFYANYMCYNEGENKYIPCAGYEKLYVTPQDIAYTGQLVILTDVGTLCAGEDIVNAIKKSNNNATIISFYPNTRGSHGLNPPLVMLPGGYLLAYSAGYVSDQNNKIMIQADQNQQGGIPTDVKIPMTAATTIDIYTNGKDLALEFAINWLNSL